MKENIEEVIEFLQEFNDGYTFQQCQTCFKFNEKDGCCNKEKCEELEAINFLISDYKRVLKENEELKHKYDKSLSDLVKAEKETIPTQKIKDILNEINKEYIKQEKIFNKHFEKENRDIQDYYIQKEATNIMQELSWIEGKLQDLLEEKGK